MRNPPSSSASASGSRKRGKLTPCCSKVGLKRGPWTPEEDEILSSYVRREGEGRWRTLPTKAGLQRCGKSCRLRWMNYLRPSIKHGQITPDEEDLIVRLHRLLGNRWSLIAGRIPGRTDNEIKNYWNTHLSKKLISQGIDPRTHKPLNPNPNPLPNPKLQAPAAPTSHPNPNPNPSRNPNPMSCPLEEKHGSGEGIIFHNSHNDYFGRTNLDHEGWQNSEGYAAMGLHGSIDNREDGGIDCCNDVFSSFLDSLINEDMFTQEEKQQQQQHNINSDENNDNNNQDYGIGSIWGASLSSAVTLDEDVNGQLADHAEKQV